jgi:ParB family transcriptional regulator, chromosome partitioning protein
MTDNGTKPDTAAASTDHVETAHSNLGSYISVDEIEVPPRIGFYWPEKAIALGKLMLVDGQLTPISLCKNGPRSEKPYRLVAGLHRLNGARMVGMRTVRYEEYFGDPKELEFIEASENMHRRDFGPIERSMFVASLADAYEARSMAASSNMSQQQAAIQARWDAVRANKILPAKNAASEHASYVTQSLRSVYGWQDEAAEALGMSVRSLQTYLFINRQICGLVNGTKHEIEMQTQGWLHHLARHALGQKLANVMEIAKIADAKARRAVIDYICAHDDVESVEHAKIGAQISEAKAKTPAAGQTKFMNNAQANLSRLSAASWTQWAPHLAQEIKPSSLIAVREAIDARITELGGAGALTASGGDQ